MAFKTELLYYNDPYRVDFDATVLSAAKVSSGENLWDVILDKTCFYPEGGGQPSDSGTIDGIMVKHVFNKTDIVSDVFFITDIFENESKDYLRKFISSVKTDNKYLICLINKTDSNFQWILASGGIDFPFSEKRQHLLSLIDARGGGKAPVWQGIGDNSGGVVSFFDALKDILVKI